MYLKYKYYFVKLTDLNLINIISYLYSNIYYKKYIIDPDIIYPVILNLSNDTIYDEKISPFLRNFVETQLSTLRIVNNIDQIDKLRNEKIGRYIVIDFDELNYRPLIINDYLIRYLYKKNLKENTCFIANISKINDSNIIIDTNIQLYISVFDTLYNLKLYIDNKLNINKIYLNNKYISYVVDVENVLHLNKNYENGLRKHPFTKNIDKVFQKNCLEYSMLNYKNIDIFKKINDNKPFTIFRFADGETMNIYIIK